MYKASQQALAHRTNLQLVSIRQSEIDYYVSIFSTMGTQAALIGGFTYGIFTLTLPSVEAWAFSCYQIYLIFSVICIASSVHIIIVTLCLQILGPGFALNGPIGSMVKSTEVMRDELGAVVIAFFIMIFFFTCSTIMSFWTVMDSTASIVCTILFFIAFRIWWHHSRRVYLRLHWDTNLINFTNNKERRPSNPAFRITGEEEHSTISMIELNGLSLSRISSQYDVIMEGYIGLKAIIDRKMMKKDGGEVNFNVDKLYYVLNNKGYLISYKSREQFRKYPNNPLHERPLNLCDYHINLRETPGIYELVLVSKDDELNGRKFLLRFDHEEELGLWKESMQAFSKRSSEIVKKKE